MTLGPHGDHRFCEFRNMKPVTAHVAMILITLAVVGSGVVVVNSFFGGSFVVGLLLIVLPFLLLAFLLPRVLPVKCPKCGARMRFRRVISPTGKPSEPRELYGYACESCPNDYFWEGASSGSSFD